MKINFQTLQLVCCQIAPAFAAGKHKSHRIVHSEDRNALKKLIRLKIALTLTFWCINAFDTSESSTK